MNFEYLIGLLGKLGYIVVYLIITILIETLVLLFFKNRKTFVRVCRFFFFRKGFSVR